jgi:hypothetical protein
MQFDDLSRKAACSTLSADERARLDETLRQHPARRFDLEWDAALHAKLDEKVAAMPALPGWDRTEQLLLAQRASSDAAQESQAVGARVARRPGLLDRLSEWLAASIGLVINAQAVAVVLVLAQAGVIGLLTWQYSMPEEGAMRTATTDAKPRGPLLRVSFRSDVREGDLRRALAAVGGEIVGGPGQLGVYLVRIKDGPLGAAAQNLRDSGTTELVEVVNAP